VEKLLVLDFGGQYAHLIAKRFRKLGYYTEIALPDVSLDAIDSNVRGIIFSGGPSSVYAKETPDFNNALLDCTVPILGLCYGHQLLSHLSGGKAQSCVVGEYGLAKLNKIEDSALFKGIDFPAQVWMSHSDEVSKPGNGYSIIGSTEHCRCAALENKEKKRFSLQFHAEVNDTLIGSQLFTNFAQICSMPVNWNSTRVLDIILSEITADSKNKKVLLFLSGGVDSSVAFALLNKALGTDRVLGLYINNGFMRKNETEQIIALYNNAGYTNFMVEDAEDVFLNAVGDETDPQKKRAIIGETFITIRDTVVKRLSLNEDEWLLAQGTLYPDIIESGGTKHSNVIKTHHNRVEGIQALIAKGLIIEPLKELYKDEVRVIGKTLGLPDELVMRHPFPGPGISVNLLCTNLDEKSYNKVEFDASVHEVSGISIKKEYSLSVLPVKSVGVQGDFRTYTYPALLDIGDFFTHFPGWDALEQLSSHITNTSKRVNRTIVLLRGVPQCKPIRSFCRKERLDMIREVDWIVTTLLKEKLWYSRIFQHLTISLPFAVNENRCSIVLRPVTSEDVMTARFSHIDIDVVQEMVKQISALPFVDCIYYDITNKPPATFGWE